LVIEMAERGRWKTTFLGLWLLAAALTLGATATPAMAATATIGQLAPGNPAPSGTCLDFTPIDRLQPTVSSGNSYVVPDGGTAITSWSTNGSADLNQTLTLKVFRKVADPASYEVVAHDTEPIVSGSLNTFPVNLPVQSGDVLGSTTNPGASGCAFAAGDSYLSLAGSLGDGQAGSFSAPPSNRLNLSAVVALAKPDNTFSFLGTKLNRKSGTAVVIVSLPGPGSLTLAGRGLLGTTASGAGAVSLPVTPKKKTRRRLRRSGVANVSVKVTFTPPGGDPNSLSAPVTLKKGKKNGR
jgi:hypothetical protein